MKQLKRLIQSENFEALVLFFFVEKKVQKGKEGVNKYGKKKETKNREKEKEASYGQRFLRFQYIA